MKPYLLHRNTAVLAMLILLTLSSWYLGMNQGAVAVSAWGGIAMLLLAFFKVRLVIQNFMEVREAPMPLRLCADGWVVSATILTLCSYLGLFA